MAVITSYATLQTAVADYLARDNLTSFIPNFIQNTENKLYRTLNLRNEETALSVSVSSGVAAVPADFKQLKFAYYAGTPADVLQWVSLDELYRDYPDRSASTSNPQVISREAGNFVFGPVASDGTLNGVYYAKLASLSTSNATNWYVTNAPEVLLYGSLLEATPFILGDERIPVWQQFFKDAVATLGVEETAARNVQSALVTRTDKRTQQP
jgi:hypothetical protein